MEGSGVRGETREILSHLGDRDARVRHVAREQLVGMGEQVLPLLLEKLKSPDWRIRWEAVKAVGEIESPENAPVDPQVASALVELLKDEDQSVRWAAMGSLIQIQRGAIIPLLLGLTREFPSACFREGAYHVLHTLHNEGQLTGMEEEVLHALKGYAPGIEAAWAANRALMAEQ